MSDLFNGRTAPVHVPASKTPAPVDGTTAPMFQPTPPQPLQTPYQGSVPGFSQPSPMLGLTPNGLSAYTPAEPNGREQSAEDPRGAIPAGRHAGMRQHIQGPMSPSHKPSTDVEAAQNAGTAAGRAVVNDAEQNKFAASRLIRLPRR